MIYTSLYSISELLNSYLKRKFKLNESMVLLSNLFDLDGSIAPQESNKVVISLVNMNKETSLGSNNYHFVNQTNTYTKEPFPLHLNLFVLISAYCHTNNYQEALKYLSAVLYFFQSNPVFNKQNCPSLPDYTEKLCFDIFNMNFQELSNLWGILGGKYLPSVVYKVRMISLDANEMKAEISSVNKPEHIAQNSN